MGVDKGRLGKSAGGVQHRTENRRSAQGQRTAHECPMGQEGHANDIQTILYHSYSMASSVTLLPPTPQPPGPAAAGRSCFDERTEHGQKHVVQSICPDPDPCVLSSSFLSPLYAGQDPAEGRRCINCRRMRIQRISRGGYVYRNMKSVKILNRKETYDIQ